MVAGSHVLLFIPGSIRDISRAQQIHILSGQSIQNISIQYRTLLDILEYRCVAINNIWTYSVIKMDIHNDYAFKCIITDLHGDTGFPLLISNYLFISTH